MKRCNAKNSEKLHLAYTGGDISIPIMPAFYIIEPTNHCNYACPICPNRLYQSSEKGYMQFSLFEKIIEEIKDFADVIQLYWVGEPLLHPRIYDMIAYCKNNTRARVMISTNGSLLTPESSKRLLESGLDKLIVSMDASDSAEVYAAMRTNGSIDALNDNVRSLLRYADKLDITLQFILTNANEAEKELFIEKWKPFGVKISIQCLYTWANQLPELNGFSSYMSPMIGNAHTPCADLWYKIAIHWNGEVSRCCFDWSFCNTVGSLADSRLAEIWNGEQMQTLRQNHHCLCFDDLCRGCDAWATEEEYEYLFD